MRLFWPNRNPNEIATAFLLGLDCIPAGGRAILIWNTAARIKRLDYLSTIGAPLRITPGASPLPLQAMQS